MLVQGHLDAGDEFAALLRLPPGRLPVTLSLAPPHAPRALRDGLRGECRARLWLHGAAATHALEAGSLPVDWSADGRDDPDAEDASRFWAELPERPQRLHRLLWLLSDHGDYAYNFADVAIFAGTILIVGGLCVRFVQVWPRLRH